MVVTPTGGILARVSGRYTEEAAAPIERALSAGGLQAGSTPFNSQKDLPEGVGAAFLTEATISKTNSVVPLRMEKQCYAARSCWREESGETLELLDIYCGLVLTIPQLIS